MRPAGPKRDRTRMRMLHPGARGRRHPMWRSSAAIIAAAVALSMGAGDLPQPARGPTTGPSTSRSGTLSRPDTSQEGAHTARVRRGAVANGSRTDPGPFLQLGCPGETSLSMINGKDSLCDYSAGSQLEAAVRFLGRHPDQVSFVTIDIGANDVVNACLDVDTGALVGLA